MPDKKTPEIRTPIGDDVHPEDDSMSRDLAADFANNLNMHEHGSSDKNKEPSSSVKKDWSLLKDPIIHTERLENIRQKKGYIIDMDGVIYHVSIHYIY